SALSPQPPTSAIFPYTNALPILWPGLRVHREGGDLEMPGGLAAAPGFQTDLQHPGIIGRDIGALQGIGATCHVPIIQNMAEMLPAELRWLITEQTFDLVVDEADMPGFIEHEYDVRRAVDDIAVQGLGFLQPGLNHLMGTNKRLLAQHTFHGCQQFFRVEGFADVIQCAPAQGPADGAERRLTADHDDTAIRL